MKPLTRPLAFTLLLGSLGLIGWGSSSNPVTSSQLEGSSAQGRVGRYALASYAPGDTTTTYTITQIVVSNATDGANGTATYTFTVSPAETFTAGESVTVSGLTGNFSILNNVAPVLADHLTATTFSITASDVYGSVNSFALGVRYATIANGTYSATGSATGTDTFGTAGVVTVSSTAPVTDPRNPVI